MGHLLGFLGARLSRRLHEFADRHCGVELLLPNKLLILQFRVLSSNSKSQWVCVCVFSLIKSSVNFEKMAITRGEFIHLNVSRLDEPEPLARCALRPVDHAPSDNRCASPPRACALYTHLPIESFCYAAAAAATCVSPLLIIILHTVCVHFINKPCPLNFAHSIFISNHCIGRKLQLYYYFFINLSKLMLLLLSICKCENFFEINTPNVQNPKNHK